MLLVALPPGDAVRTKVIRSIFQQCLYLSKNLELDIGGNHLMENLCALAFTSCLLEPGGQQLWNQRLVSMLRVELERQIDDSGEHFEMAPTYHCQMIWILLRVMIASKTSNSELHELCRGYVVRMIEFVSQILHPDGEVPLFADSGFHEAPGVETLRQLSQLHEIAWPEIAHGIGQVGHYTVFRNEGTDCELQEFAILDAGPVAPASLPAHGHCDLLNFELSIGRHRLLVDSGNFNYESDSMRDYCRSSLAHNVVTIENRNQCEIWGKFRMGRRGEVTNLKHGETDSYHWVLASHDGYKNYGVSRLNRLFAHDGHSTWICLDFSADSVEKRLSGLLHFSSLSKLDRDENKPDQFNISISSFRRRLSFFGHNSIKESTGWTCTGFGLRTISPALVYEASNCRHPIGWIISPDQSNISVDLQSNSLTILSDATRIFNWEFK